MASPQKENGYTPIANEIMEALAKIRIPGQARQVLDVILRMTYGYRKTSDHISLQQFEIATGMKRNHICRSLKILQAINMVVPIKGLGSPNKGTTATSYSFQKDFEKWTGSPNKGTGSPKKCNLGSPNKGTYKRNIVFKESIHTKHLFKNSPFFDISKFSEKLTEWPIEKITYYYHAAKDWSEAENKKKSNWISAVKNWDRMRPDEWKKGNGTAKLRTII
jgi:phage replication O-like protein O